MGSPRGWAVVLPLRRARVEEEDRDRGAAVAPRSALLVPGAPLGLLGLMVGLIGLYVASLFLVDRGDEGYLTAWDGWLFTFATLLPVVALAVRAKVDRALRLVWVLIATGLAWTWVADLVYTFHDANLADPPAMATSDLLYLAAYPFWIAGIVVLALRSIGDEYRSTLLDSVVTGLTVGAVASATWLDPLMDTAAEDLQVAVSLAFACCDLLMLVVAVVALVPGARRATPAGVAVLLAAAWFSVGDIVYLNQVTRDAYQAGTWVDATWAIAVGLFGIAGWLRSTPAGPAAPAALGLGRVPAIASLVSLGLLVVATTERVAGLAVGLAAGALALALVRVLWTVRVLHRINEGYQQARTDDLTGLGNRRHFLECVDVLTGGSSSLAVLIIDLDGFKEVNDTLGHPAGDQLLREVGNRFRSAAAEGWVLARLGGDEFGLVAPGGEEQATGLARELLASLDQPIELEGVPVRVSASIGISVTARDAVERADLIRTADVAMYEAKRTASRVTAYRPEFDPRGRERLTMVDDLCRAIEARDFRMAYQPILRADGLEVDGVELLLRWDHPRRGAVAPDEFLPVALAAGLLPQITRLVIDHGLADLGPLWRDGHGIGLSVNVSADDLVDEAFAPQVLASLRREGVDPRLLTLEVTETELASDLDRARRTLEALRRGGVRISIDDFGVGYSSLSQLLQMPLDQVKVDREFLAALERDQRAQAIVRSTVELGRTLGLVVVAEGVETHESLAIVRQAGVDLVQGYLLELPAPIETLERTIRRRAGRAADRADHPTMRARRVTSGNGTGGLEPDR